MSMTPTNQERAEFATAATEAYVAVCPTDECDALADLLTDLMHKAAAEGENFDKEIARARGHFYAEADVKLEKEAYRGNDYDNGLADIDDYEQRVRVLEAEGMSRSDAQACADAEVSPSVMMNREEF